jgi:hypothetical protein
MLFPRIIGQTKLRIPHSFQPQNPKKTRTVQNQKFFGTRSLLVTTQQHRTKFMEKKPENTSSNAPISPNNNAVTTSPPKDKPETSESSILSNLLEKLSLSPKTEQKKLDLEEIANLIRDGKCTFRNLLIFEGKKIIVLSGAVMAANINSLGHLSICRNS